MEITNTLEEVLGAFQKRSGYSFKNLSLLQEALTHRSYLNEAKEKGTGFPLRDNERFEFLGDAVLDLVISDQLLQAFPHLLEGDLSKMKARIVSEATLERVSRSVDLGRFLLIGRGEEMTGGREKSSLLADALEAVIAAVYLDGGEQAARSFIMGAFQQEVALLSDPGVSQDFKTDLQELCQKEFESLPCYSVTGEYGPDHEKTFEVTLTIKGERYGQGVGRSKKEAEQRAAQAALERLRKR